jgi:hypothetical protein
MALTQITYEDKETLVNQPSIANKNKVTSGDMNEIKSVVNGACTQIDTNTTDISNKISNTSGTSQTIGYSQEYINNYVPLKLVQEVTGQTAVQLPATWNEVVIMSTLDGDQFRALSFTLPYGAPTGQYLRLSYYGDANDNANVGYLYGADNKIQLIWYNIGGAGQTLSNVRTQIYYR